MATNNHSNIIDSERHVPYRQIFVNATARLADTTIYVAEDLYKTAYQVDTQAVYVLTAITPTWTAIAGGGGGGSNLDSIFEQRSSVQWGESTAAFNLVSSTYEIGGSGLYEGMILLKDTRATDITQDGRYVGAVGNFAGTTAVGWYYASALADGVFLTGEPVRFNFKGSVSTLATCYHYIGTAEQAVSPGLITSDDPGGDYLGFQFSSSRGDTTWQLIDDNGLGQTRTDTLITAAVDTVLYFEFEWLTTTTVLCSILDHTYTNALYTKVVTPAMGASALMNTIMFMSDWQGASTQEMMRGYTATMLHKGRSAVT